MADKTQEAEELENWIDDTREKIFKVNLGKCGQKLNVSTINDH